MFRKGQAGRWRWREICKGKPLAKQFQCLVCGLYWCTGRGVWNSSWSLAVWCVQFSSGNLMPLCFGVLSVGLCKSVGKHMKLRNVALQVSARRQATDIPHRIRAKTHSTGTMLVKDQCLVPQRLRKSILEFCAALLTEQTCLPQSCAAGLKASRPIHHHWLWGL